MLHPRAYDQKYSGGKVQGLQSENLMAASLAPCDQSGFRSGLANWERSGVEWSCGDLSRVTHEQCEAEGTSSSSQLSKTGRLRPADALQGGSMEEHEEEKACRAEPVPTRLGRTWQGFNPTVMLCCFLGDSVAIALLPTAWPARGCSSVTWKCFQDQHHPADQTFSTWSAKIFLKTTVMLAFPAMPGRSCK